MLRESVPAATRWSRIFGPVLTLKEIHVICWALFAAFLVAPGTMLIIARLQHGALLDRLEVDFTYFYGLGRILNEHPPGSLYDYELQKRVFTAVHPLNSGTYGPSPYPPFVGMMFRPLARLPFESAYLIWAAVSLSLYLWGLWLLGKRYLARSSIARSLTFCLALSFYPFAWTFVSGQLSTVAFFAVTLALLADDRERPLASGLALGVCAYKPVLLIWFVPMLLVSRRYRALLGVCISAATLVAAVTLVEGPTVWSGYLNLILPFGQSASRADVHSLKEVGKFVDLAAFWSSIVGSRQILGTMLTMVTAAGVAVTLFRLWRRTMPGNAPAGALVFSATLTWTLVANVYTPMYDCVVAVPGIIACASYVPDRRFPWICAMTFIAAWISMPVAQATGLQLLTICLAVVAWLQTKAAANA